jgi:hypothetical protein
MIPYEVYLIERQDQNLEKLIGHRNKIFVGNQHLSSFVDVALFSNYIQMGIQYGFSSSLREVFRSLVVSVADCYPKGAGFDSRVILGVFPVRKRGLRTLV